MYSLCQVMSVLLSLLSLIPACWNIKFLTVRSSPLLLGRGSPLVETAVAGRCHPAPGCGEWLLLRNICALFLRTVTTMLEVALPPPTHQLVSPGSVLTGITAMPGLG